MAISDKEIKKLWGKAAGICNFPGCNEECIKYLDQDNSVVVGEMAHVIAKEANGPRGIPTGGEDVYENLILLCPTHHTLVDKAPDFYSTDLLLEYKNNHENRIKQMLESKVFINKKDLYTYISKILIENKTIWKTYGPESEEAIRNPLSNLWIIWEYRKIQNIIPNNIKIINAINKSSDLIPHKEYEIACNFIEHAVGFEKRAYEIIEGVPKFPVEFERMIYAGI